MQVHVNTDNHITGREALVDQVRHTVETALERFSGQITRVEVHLSDENGKKAGQDDKRCVMEARIEGLQPLAVTHHAANLNLAVDGAAGALTRVIEKTLGRLHDQKLRRTEPPPPGALTPE